MIDRTVSLKEKNPARSRELIIYDNARETIYCRVIENVWCVPRQQRPARHTEVPGCSHVAATVRWDSGKAASVLVAEF